MAIKSWKDFGKQYGGDDDLRRALLDSGIDFKALPDDDTRIRTALDYLKKNYKYWGEKRYDDLRMEYGERFLGNKETFSYTPKDIMGELKYKDLDKFRENYWKADKEKRAYWKTVFENGHGKGSWELAKKTMQADLHNTMMKDIEKNRSDILEGNAKDSPWYDYVNSALMGLFTPRIKSALKEGRDIGATDILGDIAENAAYAVFPVGRVGGLAARGIARPLSKVLSQNTAKGAGKLLGGALAEFGAPATIEAADYGLNKADTWLTGAEDDARFEPEDILLGGFTNLGVNKGLGRTAGLVLNTMGKKVSGKKIPKPVKDRLEGVKSPKERAEEMVEGARETLRESNMSPADAYAYVAREGRGLPSVKEQESAIEILKVAEQADPELRGQALDYARGVQRSAENSRNAFAEVLDDLESRKTGAGMEHELGLMDDASYKELTEALDKEIDNTRWLMVNSSERAEKAATRVEELESSARAQDILDALPAKINPESEAGHNLRILNGPPPAATFELSPTTSVLTMLEAGFGLPDGTFASNPELLALFGKELKPTLGERLGEAAFSWAVNKAGTDSDAQVASTITHGAVDTKKLREGQYERREKARTGRAAKTLEASVASQYELTDEDRKWLKKISENPGIVKGYGKDAMSSDFNIWMIRRGTDLLKNTEFARPAFEVE